jgi:hypothetical protein
MSDQQTNKQTHEITDPGKSFKPIGSFTIHKITWTHKIVSNATHTTQVI